MKKFFIVLLLIPIFNISVSQNCPPSILGNDTSFVIVCQDEVLDISNIYNLTNLIPEWNIPNPTLAGLGINRLIVTDIAGCRDTAFISIRQDIKTWLGAHSDDWHDSMNWTENSIPGDSTHVLVNSSTLYPCIIKSADSKVASLQVNKDANYQITNNRKLEIKSKCNNLPPLYELAPNAIIIDNQTAQLLQLVSPTQVIFNGNSSQLQSIVNGNIIVSGSVLNAPYGFMRKITNIQINGFIYTFTTVEVSLTETFKELHVDYTRLYSNADTLHQRSISSLSFNVSIPDFILYDGDGNNITTDDQLKVSGNLNVTPEMHINLDINNYHLSYAKFECGFESLLNQTISAGGSIGNINPRVTIFSKPLALFNIPGTPIVVVPNLKVDLGAEASINVEINASNTNSNHIKAFIQFQYDSWNYGNTRDMQNQYNFSGINGDASAKIFVEPSIEFKLFNSNWAKGTISSQAYLKATGHLLSSPDCKLEAGISASAEVNREAFGFNLGIAFNPEIFNQSVKLYSCAAPILTTSVVSNITSSTAMSGGNITSQGGSAIIARGVCWSTNTNPTIFENKTDDGAGTGNFFSTISNLLPGKYYYLKAYAINSTDTAYGNEIIFTTPDTIVSCGQVWMAKNLSVSKYRNGDPIPQVTDPFQWATLSSGAWCYYNNDPANEAIYGKLYNGYAMNDPRGLAPTGWHIPSDLEWSSLLTCLGGGQGIVGGKMKSTGISYWEYPNGGATNSSGFTGLPGGYRYDNDGLFYDMKYLGFWWSSTSNGGNYYFFKYYLGWTDPGIIRDDWRAGFGISVRCVKD